MNEIVRIRTADRHAQGVTTAQEQAARAAIARAVSSGSLTTVIGTADIVSPITDFMDPAYSGKGYHNLLIIKPDGLSFFGSVKSFIN